LFVLVIKVERALVCVRVCFARFFSKLKKVGRML